MQKTEDGAVFLIFCGNGNNGGDGFIIARILYQSGFDVNVFINKDQAEYSTDAKINFDKVMGISGIGIFDFDEIGDFQIDGNAVIIDALFGTGLNRSLDGKSAKIIQFLNRLSFPKFAIDIPSGLFADRISDDNPVIFKADETLSIQFWKRTFLHPETGIFCGKINILDNYVFPK